VFGFAIATSRILGQRTLTISRCGCGISRSVTGRLGVVGGGVRCGVRLLTCRPRLRVGRCPAHTPNTAWPQGRPRRSPWPGRADPTPHRCCPQGRSPLSTCLHRPHELARAVDARRRRRAWGSSGHHRRQRRRCLSGRSDHTARIPNIGSVMSRSWRRRAHQKQLSGRGWFRVIRCLARGMGLWQQSVATTITASSTRTTAGFRRPVTAPPARRSVWGRARRSSARPAGAGSASRAAAGLGCRPRSGLRPHCAQETATPCWSCHSIRIRLSAPSVLPLTGLSPRSERPAGERCRRLELRACGHHVGAVAVGGADGWCSRR
jgi:hypothetical protein